MPHKIRLAYLAHTLRSDWNNGNAHFLRGLLRSLARLGHSVETFEPECSWSFENLQSENAGQRSLERFLSTYPDLHIHTYAEDDPDEVWLSRLRDVDVVVLHEWNPPALGQQLLRLRERLGYRLLFHDTHHRASSTPEQMAGFGLDRFDGIIAFGEALRGIYRERFSTQRVWTLHEAADTSVFHPHSEVKRAREVVWIGNWGDGERSEEIGRYLLQPASALRDVAHTTIYGVRYPKEGLHALAAAGVTYGGYLANLDAPETYARALATVHVPRQHYVGAMTGIPTIRVFEALACGTPLVSAPWQDTEQLFRPRDFRWAANSSEMEQELRLLLTDPPAAEDQAAHGMETVLARHTCDHRAAELSAICEEVLG